MTGNINNRPIGKCSECGGIVSVPLVYWSVNRPVPKCERCGALADESEMLPIVQTRKTKPKLRDNFRGYKDYQNIVNEMRSADFYKQWGN